MAVRDVKELTVYIKAYRIAMDFFEISKRFPTEERYALTSQGRRSSRSVCHNLREAWAKRRYEAHFVSKLSDCIGENWETDTAIDFARDYEPDSHDPEFKSGNQIRFDVIGDGEFRNYQIKLSSVPGYNGALSYLMVKPVPRGEKGAWVKLERIRLGNASE